MSVQWIVHSGSQQLGPWSASRIREELRSGRIDAFDKVSAVGSTVKRPLIEVDEIFETSHVQAAAFVTEAKVKELNLPEYDRALPLAAGAEPRQNSDQNKKKSERDNTGSITEAPTRPRAFEALASPEALAGPARATPSQGQQKKQSTASGIRRYIIWTPDRRSQGPFSSQEVLTLWYAKKLDHNAQIQRLGDSKRIEISRFVSFYERAEPSGIAFLVNAKKASQARDWSSWWFVLAIMLAGAMIFGALAYRSARDIEEGPDATNDSLNRKSKPEVKVIPIEAVAEPQTTESQPAAMKLPPSETLMPLRPGSSTPAMPKAKVATRKPQVQRKPVTRTERRTPPPAIRSTPPALPQPVVPVSTPIVNRSVTKPTFSGTAGTGSALKDGATVTLTGYRFNIGLLNSCELKCKIPMFGAQGPVTAVFFKEAFGAALASKSAGVTIIGTIRKDPASGRVSIFVQSIR